MFTRIGDRIKRKIERGVDKISRPSSPKPSPSVPVNDSGSTSNPPPAASLRLPVSESRGLLAPPHSSSQIGSISAPRSAVASLALPSTDTLSPAPQPVNSGSPSSPDPAPAKLTTTTSAGSTGPEQSGRSAAWSGLGALLGLLKDTAVAFGPLKDAVGGILTCVEIYEEAAKGRDDYKKLRAELDSLFWELFGLLGGPTPPSMTFSLANLARGIEREIGFVLRKEKRNKIQQAAEARENAGEIFECYQRVQRLLERFSLNANVNTWKIADEQATEHRLEKLSPSQAAHYGSAESTNLGRNQCIPGTRIDLLNQLEAWAEDSDSKKIYWLNGMAGTGKTTIAYSFCDLLKNGLTLAASFFCSRQLEVCRNANLILPTIAYQLARFSRPFRYHLSKVLEQDPDVHTRKISEQFQSLIFGPLLEVKESLPLDLVVVIDALDECDNKDSVCQILEVLISRATQLPIRFFMTSRPEPRILDEMEDGLNRNVAAGLHLHDIEDSIVSEDIRTYLRVKLERFNLSNGDLEKLVNQSGVLFIYAATVALYVNSGRRNQCVKRLQEVLDASVSSKENSDRKLGDLYGGILNTAFHDESLNNSNRGDMKAMLHTVICAREPLTTRGIASLLGLDRGSVQVALEQLGSVLHLSEAKGVVTTLHKSFPDYMFDSDRSQQFYCDAHLHNAQLALRCFDLIRTHNPPFNICSLESSYEFDDIPGLAQRIEDAISEEMFYACQHWGSHLVLAKSSLNLVDALRAFLSERLLFWMEVMNLKQRISTAVAALHRLQAWLQNASSSEDVQELALDAWRFVIAFSTSSMSRSTPHIYVSALPFWPSQRPVSKCYLPRMQGLVGVSGRAMERRERAALVVCATTDAVLCVAYSFDNTRIVSGSQDGNVGIWDAHTGQMVGGLLGGHTGAVNSVGYSHDNTRIASASDDCTIRIWDAHTGQMLGEPLQGHTSSVRSVAYSHDGQYIISGSGDRTIRIWDAHTCQMVGEPLQGHTDWVRSVSYSGDSMRIVSGSDDRTIRIWDAHTGQMLGKPFEGHTGWVFSVSYSQDGTHIVSGSNDYTIRIWDARTGQMVGEPLCGHTSSITSARFSDDGTLIISGSADTTVRVWDACTGQMVGEPIQGHDGNVNSVTCSHDGTRIASGSNDKTMRIWDARISELVGEPLDGHTDRVCSVAYSRDGQYIASGSDDKTIRVWDAHTGQMVGEPLKVHTGCVPSVSYSHDGTRIVSGSVDNTIRIWDVRTSQMLGEPLQGHTDWVRSVAYSHDGTQIVSGSDDWTIRIWNAHTGQMLGEPLQGHTQGVSSVAYSHDGTHIISGSDDKTIRIWDVHTGRMVGDPLRGHSGAVNSVAYSHDNTHIVSGSHDKAIRIWDAHTGQMVGDPLQGHDGPVYSVTYSHDGTRIVSSSYDKTIRIWDAHTGEMVGEPLQGHTGGVLSVVYSRNGNHIVSGSTDTTLRIWDASPEQITDGISIGQRRVKASQQSTTDIHATWQMNEHGWVLSGNSKLLIWVPSDVRVALMRPRNLFIISRSGSLALDFSNAKLGKEWGECYRSNELSSL